MPRKVAILGGGIASLVAAWALVESDPDAYEITVYQQGFRLGGKCASGRRTDDSRGEPDHRIQEHGLHLFFGFYENIFRVVRGAYTSVYGDDTTWRDFFKTDGTDVGLVHFLNAAQTEFELWKLPRPKEDLGTSPGSGDGSTSDVGTILKNIWNWIGGLAADAARAANVDPGQVFHKPPSLPIPPGPPGPNPLPVWRVQIDALPAPKPWPVPGGPIPPGIPAAWDYALPFMDALSAQHHGSPLEQHADAGRFAKLLEFAGQAIHGLAQRAPLLTIKTGWSRPVLDAALDFMGAVARGLFLDLFLKKSSSWFALDQFDFATWITQHGGNGSSPLVVGLYDLVFATNSQLGAGCILQSTLKALFLFKGGTTYKMQSGMGDTVFGPLYLALKSKNVTFRFFHRVERLTPSADGRFIDEIRFERQINLTDEYDPLIDVDVDIGGQRTLKCWPDTPIWTRLPPDEVLRVKDEIDLESYWTPVAPDRALTLKRGDPQGFDEVILGISVAALADICADLMPLDSAFADHVRTLSQATTATLGLQLWTVPGHSPDASTPVLGGYVEPLDTIADMSHLLKAESWPAGTVDAIRFLCSPLKEASPPPSRSVIHYPGALRRFAFAQALSWMSTAAPRLWTHLSKDGAFDWDALVDPDAGVGADRLKAQFLASPVNLSDRYVVSPPMTYSYRLLSNGTKFLNLYLAGDWTRTALSIGCAEAAAMGGIQAARALSMETNNTLVSRAAGDWIEDVQPRARGTATFKATSSVPYRQRDGELVAPAPYQINVSNLFLSLLAADSAQLGRLCDRELNPGSSVQFGPLGNFVVLYGARIDNFSLGTTCSTQEVGIWVPLVATANGAKSLQIYSPYVWIDSPTSALVGRSIYGYAKMVANVVVPGDGDALNLSVAGDVLASGATGSMQVRPRPIVSGGPGTQAPWKTPSGVVTGVADILSLLVDLIGNRVTAPELPDLRSLLNGMTSVFLKELPAPAGPDATYLAIVNSAISPEIDSLRAATLPDPWAFELPLYTEPRVVENLGIDAAFSFDESAQSVYSVTSFGQLWVSFRGSIEPGSEASRVAP